MPSKVRSVIVYPHTHWDREWYERAVRFKQRLVEVMSDVLDRLECDARIAVFLLDGQTAILHDYLSVRPDDEHRIRSLAQQGRLELGPWFVLADEFLTTDETLVRNLLLGKVDGERFGSWMALGYCPDSFGHPAALPTILNGFGIEDAIVWRGYGRDLDGPDLFRWDACDGSSVLTHHLPPDGYEIGAELEPDRRDLAARWDRLRTTLFARASGSAVLVPNGADHHGLQPDVADVVATLGQLDNSVRFRIASPESYFTEIRETLGPVKRIAGELRDSYGYTWSLQGIHSTRSRLKRLMAKCERTLVRWAEPQCAMALLSGGRNRKVLLDDAWKTFLESCAHDSIGGCSTDGVAGDVAGRAEAACRAAEWLFTDAMDDRLRQDRFVVRRSPTLWESRLVIVNPSPRQRSGVVEATITLFREDVVVGRPPEPGSTTTPVSERTFCLRSGNGKILPMQILSRYQASDRLDSPRSYPDQDIVDAVKVLLPADNVPALGSLAYEVVDGLPSKVAGKVPGRVIVDGYRVSSDRASVNTAVRAFCCAEGSTSLSPVVDLISERDVGDTYTFEPLSNDEPLYANWSPAKTIWTGPLGGCIARDFRIPGRVVGTVYARIDAGSRVVRWAIEGNNLSGNHRVRVLFALPPGSNDRSVADQHFGPVTRMRSRPEPAEFPNEQPVDSAPCHRYVSVPGTSSGISIFPRGIFEYAHTDEHLALTMLRAVGWLSRDDLKNRPGNAGWPEPTPLAQEIGHFRVEFGSVLLAIDEDSTAQRWSELESYAEEYHAPLTGLMYRRSLGVPMRTSGPRLDGDGLVFKSLKRAERGDGVVFRCVNVSREDVGGLLQWPEELAGAAQVRLDETPIRDLALGSDLKSIAFQARRREVVSVLVWT